MHAIRLTIISIKHRKSITLILAVEQQGHAFECDLLSVSRFIRPPSVCSSRNVPAGDISVGDGAVEIAPTAFRGCILCCIMLRTSTDIQSNIQLIFRRHYTGSNRQNILHTNHVAARQSRHCHRRCPRNRSRNRSQFEQRGS